MTVKRRASGEFALPVSAAEAIAHFTPEGERAWAIGWDPTYPAGEISEESGTVFVTSHGATKTFWVIEEINRKAQTAAYALVTAGERAGTVRVRCEDDAGGCRVDVEYNMTALDANHPEVLDMYEAEAFGAMMHHWSAAVRKAL